MKKLLFLIFSASVLFSFKSSETVEIKWDFSKYKKLTYSYNQKMEMKINSFIKDHSGIEGEGIIEIIVIDSAFAHANIKIHKAESYDMDSIGNKVSERMDFIPPTLVINGLKEDDTSKILSNPEEEMFIKSLFPVIKEAIGKTPKKYPLNFRFNNQGKMLNSTGDSFLRLENIEKDICHLELNYDLKNIHDDTNQEVKFSVIGNSKLQFNSTARYFIKGVSWMSVRIEDENPHEPEFAVETTINYELISVE